jgi:hypothetical protein
MELIPKQPEYPYNQLRVVDLGKPREIAEYLQARGVTYRLGGKASDLANLDSIRSIDCSGFRDVCLYHLTGGSVDWGIGEYSSQYVEPWEMYGFKAVAPTDATNDNGALYIFELPAGATSDGIGHTGFVRDSLTAESYGGHGPGSRPWGPGHGEWDAWQQHCRLWVLHLGDG